MTAVAVAVAVAEAASRHPSARRWRADLHAMADRVADHLQRAGVPYPGAAAAARAVRGATGLDRQAFASELELDVDAVTAIESGSVSVHELPLDLLRVGAFLDWASFAVRDLSPTS